MDAFAVFVGFAILFVNRTNVFTAFTRVFFREKVEHHARDDDSSDEEPVACREVKDTKTQPAPAELPEEELSPPPRPSPSPPRPATPIVEEETIDEPLKIDEPARLPFAGSMPTFNDMLNVLARWTREEQPAGDDRTSTPAREEANCSPFFFIEQQQ
jgi:hypothetical protein